MGRNVHVLFVHGVGRHSPLSSLLRAYQALRSDLNSDEPPTIWEDPIPDWSLTEFDDTGPPRYLRLSPRYQGDQEGPDSVFLYEVNYSALAGIIRANQPIDLTQLFLGFDLATNVARQRLEHDIGIQTPQGGHHKDVLLAHEAQKIAEVLVAATMPILGVPAILFRQYTETLVSAFARFFEDIVTFALDKNGEQLISRHVDHTLQTIINSPRFQKRDNDNLGDTFVIAAHSLGSVVIHNFLLRHWAEDGPEVPARLITYGCPIGLVCWAWRFLDFPRMKFSTEPDQSTGDEFFCWKPEEPSNKPLRPISWLNILNLMDPIATAFPIDDVNLAMPRERIQSALIGGKVTHHYRKSGSIFSAHTNYMQDRDGFVELLARAAELTPDAPPEPKSRNPERHWRSTTCYLRIVHWFSWALGMLTIGAYIYWLSSLCDHRVSRAMFALVLYTFPRVTLGYIAFFQKLLFGAPTRLLSPEMVRKTKWLDWHSLPYRLRLAVRMPSLNRPRIAKTIVGLLPAAGAMGIPLLFWRFAGVDLTASLLRLIEHPYQLAGLISLFALYAIAFAYSEFTRHWINVLKIAVQNS